MMRTLRTIALSFAAFLFLGSGIAKAVAPQFDNGTAFDLSTMYTNVQKVSNFYSNTGIYGKLDLGPDVYQFTPDQDGSQTISLLGVNVPAAAQPTLVVMDPTSNTPDSELNIPTPDSTYHVAVITPEDGTKTYDESALFQRYTLLAQRNMKFVGGKTYYLVVFDATRTLNDYVIKFGDGKVWSAGDVFKHLASWFKARTGSYGGSSPFHFTPTTFGGLLFTLGLAILTGMWIIESAFAFLSNRAKMAGYILIKLQSFSRYFTWMSLAYIAIGGWIVFSRTTWLGLATVQLMVFIALAAVFLVRTLVLSPQLMKLEVSKQEAVIPKPLAQKLYILFVLETLSLLGFIVLLTISIY